MSQPLRSAPVHVLKQCTASSRCSSSLKTAVVMRTASEPAAASRIASAARPFGLCKNICGTCNTYLRFKQVTQGPMMMARAAQLKQNATPEQPLLQR
jgi:hypothetical protein